VYTTEQRGSGEVTSADDYPGLVLDGTVHFEDARTTPPTVFDLPVHATTPETLSMAPEDMAARYPSAVSLYTDFGNGLGGSVGEVIARTLCLR
jgi:hypothetical protein